MTAGVDEITQLALTLPVDQRAQVANALLASLDDAADPADVHEAWTAEIESRVDDIVSGRVQGIPGMRSGLSSRQTVPRGNVDPRRSVSPRGTC